MSAARRLIAVLCFAAMLTVFGCAKKDGPPVYADPQKPIDERVDDLLARMTLEEKIGQLNMPCVYVDGLGKTQAEKMTSVKKFAEGTLVENIGPSGGYFTLANTILPDGPRPQAEFFNELQQISIGKTRLKIPLLQVEEGTHGLMCSGGTIFPEGLGIGATWNMPLVRKVYEVAAREARSLGIHSLFTLVVEPTRDPRLGRNEEGYSEDPYLCSRIAVAIVQGTQGQSIAANDRVVAGLCHYPGQAQPVGGHERGEMDIPERTLREVFLPPWVAGITKSGALGVMATYPAIDSVPVHKSEKILTRLLRDELGFQGLVLSEGSGISTLLYEHVAADEKEAGILSLKAGVDVGISHENAYMNLLRDAVNDGTVPVSLVDRSVRRILKLKMMLGLFENPTVDVDRAVQVSHTAENQDLALQVAREGVVLLKNERSLLPVSKNVKSIAVIGPNADHERNQLGDYIAHNILQNVVTVLEGIRGIVPQAKIEYVKGCDVIGNGLNEIAAAQAAARRAQVAVVVVGENERRAPNQTGTDGEGKDVASLDLTGMQEELVKAVHATGTPTIVVLVNGRPLTTPWIAENVPALIEAWNCGEKGGQAVAEILFGDCNPSGRLPVTIPRHVGQYPFYYNFKPSKAYWDRRNRGYVDMSFAPLYEFGYGLSYTTFEYSNLRIDTQQAADGMVQIAADVKNTGARSGDEVVQLYIRDEVSSVTRPVKELKGFEKVALNPSETKTVRFLLTPEDLSMLDENLVRVVEAGKFSVMVGSSSANTRLTGSFEIPRRIAGRELAARQQTGL